MKRTIRHTSPAPAPAGSPSVSSAAARPPLNPGLPIPAAAKGQRWEVRTVHPDTLHRAGYVSREAAQAYVDRRGNAGRFAYCVAPSPSTRSVR